MAGGFDLVVDGRWHTRGVEKIWGRGEGRAAHCGIAFGPVCGPGSVSTSTVG